MSSPSEASDKIASATGSLPDPILQLANAPIVVRYVAALAMTALATAVAVAFDSTMAVPNLSLIFVVPVVVSAVFFGLDSSLFSAALGALAYNYFLTEPRFSLAVDDPANIWAIALFFVVGCIVSAVASTARSRAVDATLLLRQATMLRDYSRGVVGTHSLDAILSSTAGILETIFNAPVVVMTMSQVGPQQVKMLRRSELNQAEVEAARAVLTGTQELRGGVYPFDASRFDFWPVVASSGRSAVIGVAFSSNERPPEPGVFVQSVASVLAMALDRPDLVPTSTARSRR